MAALVGIGMGYSTAGRVRPRSRRAVASPLPCGGRADASRPPGRTPSAVSAVAVARAQPSACGVRSARVGVRRTLLAAVLVLAALGWLTFLVHVREGAASVPAATTVVQVGAGETLFDVARRGAPGAPTDAVVQRIRELNGLDGSSVHVGQPLVVPDGRGQALPGESSPVSP